VFTTEFDYDLPDKLIAQTPARYRDQSRLLVLDRNSRQIAHRQFRDLIGYLQPRDVLVLNNSRVIPARLRGVNSHTGGRFEILLLEEASYNDWWVLLRPGKRARVGTQISICNRRETTDVSAVVIETNEEGHRRIRFDGSRSILDLLDRVGEVPLPPYISRSNSKETESDRARYQTVFAKSPGSVAAPTAGLHFTESFLDEIRARNIEVCFVTLHVGLGTFAPVKAENLSAHKMHEERFEIPEATAQIVDEAKRDGRRIIAVGTTTLRVLEGVAEQTSDGERSLAGVKSGSGRTRIFIYPPYDFKIVDALLTNFHLPRSTLLMLVSAFAAPKETGGRDVILSAYAQAIKENYRFFSYGDAMFIQ
jgi:S-adenosylmethionine:tRNA ribosyltransferase-isomerase